MSENNKQLDLFKTLSPEELAKVVLITDEELDEAFRKGEADRKAVEEAQVHQLPLNMFYR